MSNLVELRACVLEKVVSSLLDDPTSLEFSASLLPGRTNFTIQTTAAATGRLVGYGGAHLRAIQLVAEVMGREIGQEWRVKLEDAEDTFRPKAIRAQQPDEWDCTDDALMLQDVLEALGIAATVNWKGGIAGGFDFEVRPQAQQDESALLDPYEARFERNQKETGALNLITAIRCWLNAVGKRSGVIYRIEIV